MHKNSENATNIQGYTKFRISMNSQHYEFMNSWIMTIYIFQRESERERERALQICDIMLPN